MDGPNLIFIVMPIVIPLALFLFIGLPLGVDGVISKRQREAAMRKWAAAALESRSPDGSSRSLSSPTESPTAARPAGSVAASPGRDRGARS